MGADPQICPTSPSGSGSPWGRHLHLDLAAAWRADRRQVAPGGHGQLHSVSVPGLDDAVGDVNASAHTGQLRRRCSSGGKAPRRADGLERRQVVVLEVGMVQRYTMGRHDDHVVTRWRSVVEVDGST